MLSSKDNGLRFDGAQTCFKRNITTHTAPFSNSQKHNLEKPIKDALDSKHFIQNQENQ